MMYFKNWESNFEDLKRRQVQNIVEASIDKRVQTIMGMALLMYHRFNQ